MTIKRKKLFVDKAVQGAILLRMAIHVTALLIAAGALLYFVELISGDPRQAGENMLIRHGPTALALLFLAPVCWYDLCKLTNRFAGPMVRLHRAMKYLAEGREVAPIKFREGDFWQDLAADFNRVAERVQTKQDPADDPTPNVNPVTEKTPVHAWR